MNRRNNFNSSIVVLGGGTGGHLFPAYSLVKDLIQKDLKAILITDQRGFKILESYQKDLPNIQKDHLDKKNILFFFLKRRPSIVFIIYTFLSIIRCISWFISIRPSLIISFGGYTSIAPLLAAWLMKIPIVIYEQNAVLGKSNRFLLNFASLLMISFPKIQFFNKNVKIPIITTNNPVRFSIKNLIRREYKIQRDGAFRLCILGGSQGAKIFSEIIPRALSKLDDKIKNRLIIYQQCRYELLAFTKELYNQAKLKSIIKPFFNDIDQIYKKSHLAISRAGAMTITELSIAGIPSILIPYKYSADGHQQLNANYVEEIGGAWVIEEEKLTCENLASLISAIISNNEILYERSKKIRNFLHHSTIEFPIETIEKFISLKGNQ